MLPYCSRGVYFTVSRLQTPPAAQDKPFDLFIHKKCLLQMDFQFNKVSQTLRRLQRKRKGKGQSQENSVRIVRDG